jgi:hypothetical protein
MAFHAPAALEVLPKILEGPVAVLADGLPLRHGLRPRGLEGSVDLAVCHFVHVLHVPPQVIVFGVGLLADATPNLHAGGYVGEKLEIYIEKLLCI